MKIIYNPSILAFSLLILSIPCFAQQSYEGPGILPAAKILPPDVIRGTYHQVDEQVANDGFLNTYTIHSNYGDVQATSTGTLRKYIDEIKAVARMKEIQGSEEFTKGMTDKARDVVEGAKGLVADPVGSVSSTVSGVGKLFSRASENLTGDSRSDAEGSRMASLLGYEKAKRDIGYQFGIDVYSRNKILQDELNSLSGASGTGTLVMSGLLMAVPGGAGIAVSVTGSSELMKNVMRDSAPADLRKMNRDMLAAMGVNADIADLYIANSIYTPLEQTLIVAALDKMSNTRNRAEFVKFATIIDNPDMAYFRQRQAQMYEGYNRLVEPIVSFVPVGQMTAGLTNTSKIIINIPVDYLTWTTDLAATASAVSKVIDSVQGVTERQLWITGMISNEARKSLQQMGWVVQENSETKVGLPVY